MTAAVCGVAWCPAFCVTGRLVCAFHAKRPVLSSIEKHDDYLARLRREDAGRGHRHRITADVEPVPLITSDVGDEPNIARPKGL